MLPADGQPEAPARPQKPILHLIAGPNGAGKSTLYRYLIQPRYPHLMFVNADVYERDHLAHVQDAAKRSEAARAWADKQREMLLAAGHGFVTETVFSHPSKLHLIDAARDRGFEVALYVVCLDEPRRLLERVRGRVDEGGHPVPANKILERYPRTIANLRDAVGMVDLALLFDASEVEAGGPHLIASVAGGVCKWHLDWHPTWARRVLELVR